MSVPYPTVTGVVTARPPQVQSYKVSASAVSPTITVLNAETPPSPPPTPPLFVTSVDGIATSPDNPAMAPFPVKAFFIQGQTDAVKSAAANTALAFNLNVAFSSDVASKFAMSAFKQDVTALPNLVETTVVILPP